MDEKNKRKWTRAQEQAINTRDKTLLVSAAAGSGKTATLTERIIRSILDKDNPINIEDMLIVTFTRAAAGELRERIGIAIKKALDDDPCDAHLEHQLHMLPMAKISTIDAFCTDILRANCDALGINPAFRIPDGAEAALLSENILDGLFNEIYSGRLAEIATPEELDELAQSLTNMDRQSELAAVISGIYRTTIYAEDGADSLLPLVEEFNPERFISVEKTNFGAYVMGRVKEMSDHYIKVFKSVADEIAAVSSSKLDKLEEQQRQMAALFERVSKIESYTQMRQFLNDNAVFSLAVSNKDPSLPPTTELRKMAKNDLSNIQKKFFSYTEENWKIAYEGLYQKFGVLFRIIKKFETLLREEKLRRGILEFSDILRFSYECLWQEGELTEIAHSEREKYAAIYIDEYQDVNGLQNKIFEAISKENNRFMVGDIKQSIYAFRSARADIFAKIKTSFPPIEQSDGSMSATIFMSENFRCDEGIIDFVNLIFDKLFSVLGETIGYMEGDKLKFAKVYPEGVCPEYRKPELALVDINSYAKAHRIPGTMRGDPRFPTSALSPALVAEKIKELLDGEKKNNGEPIRPEDIAIIMRKGKGRVGLYKDALQKLGIGAAYAEDVKFFSTPESQLVLCLLNAINNPRKDIYLAGLLMSPLYGFTADELAIIGNRCGCLYESLKQYVQENPRFEKGRDFLENLKKYRLLAEGRATDVLLMRLYHETGLLALCAKRGTEERLLQLYEYARSFERGSYRGLYNFISYVNSIAKRESSLDKKEAPKADNKVSIITGHGSKGLEFPVVFFVGAEDEIEFKPFGEAPRYEYEEGFGIGMYLRTPSGLSLVKNPTKDVIIDYRQRREIEEEARLLYVILTRARERLYVLGAPRSDLTALLKEMRLKREYFSKYTVYNSKNYIDLILGCADIRVLESSEFVNELPPVFTDSEEITDTVLCPVLDVEEGSLNLNMGSEKICAQMLKERFDFGYPGSVITYLPKKLAISALYPEILDGMSELTASADIRADKAKLRYSALGILPEFMTGEGEDTPTQRGIATHLLMQFCDLDRLFIDGVEAELERLKEAKFLSSADANRVIVEEVELFRRSELLDKMRNAKKLYREFRFNVKLPAQLFTFDEQMRSDLAGEELLVQGVIDCLFEDDEGELHLIDYKTDRLTKKELSDRELAKEKLNTAHKLQLGYYREAVRCIFGKYPTTVQVYSLPLGDTVPIDIDLPKIGE